jgi:hypothetical protein
MTLRFLSILLFSSGAVLTFVLSYRDFRKTKNKALLAVVILLLVAAAMTIGLAFM